MYILPRLNILPLSPYNINPVSFAQIDAPSNCVNGDAYECSSLTRHINCVYGCDLQASKALHIDACVGSCCKYCYKNCHKCSKILVGFLAGLNRKCF